MNKAPARLVIIALTIGALFFTLSSLFGRHLYGATYGRCLNGQHAAYCDAWNLQALFQAFAIVAVAIAAWIYNERRVSP